MARGDEGIDQSNDVLYFRRIGKQVFFGKLGRYGACGQRLFHNGQVLVFSRHDNDFARRQARLYQAAEPAGGLLAFKGDEAFFGFELGRGEAVAPCGGVCLCVVCAGFSVCVGVGGCFGFFIGARDLGQCQHVAAVLGLRGVGAVLAHQAVCMCCEHVGIDCSDDGLCVAAGVVATQCVAFEGFLHKRAGGAEDFGVGTAKAVDALLGVAHDKHAGRLPRARVALQPCVQGLPLQGVGVLKFVYEQVAHAGIEPLLHPCAQMAVLQQHAGGAFYVVHVNPALAVFDLRVDLAQLAR